MTTSEQRERVGRGREIVSGIEERKHSYTPKPGSFESVLMILKQEFAELTTGMGDTPFWEPIETRATMSVGEGCFQYYLAGDSHRLLALKVVNYFNPTHPDKMEWRDRVADELFKKYPPRYRQKWLRNHPDSQ